MQPEFSYNWQKDLGDTPEVKGRKWKYITDKQERMQIWRNMAGSTGPDPNFYFDYYSPELGLIQLVEIGGVICWEGMTIEVFAQSLLKGLL